MHINVKEFWTFHLSLLRDRWKLIFPVKRQIFHSVNFRLFSWTPYNTYSNFWRLQFVSQKPTAIIRKFFQSYSNWVVELMWILCDIQYFSSILMFKEMLCEWGLWDNSWVKNSPYVHLLLGGEPQASCTPHSGLPGRAKNFNLVFDIRI